MARLAVLSREHFLDFIRASPNVAVEMLTALTRRLRRTDELLRNLATRNVNVEEASQLTMADRAADIIAEFGGSWKFIGTFISLFLLWVILNSFFVSRLLFGREPFDKTPYILLNLLLNMIT